MTRPNLVILFGGKSSEYEVSCVSAYSVVKNIQINAYNVITIGITKDGNWLLYQGDVENIRDGTWQDEPKNKRVFLSPSPSFKKILVYDDKNNFEQIDVDVVFPVLHGKNGEDGTIQGLFQLSEIPFVGCDTCSSAACMDKVITCFMLANNGISKPNFHWFLYNDFDGNQSQIIGDIESKLGAYPLFVKPANSGSSVGISKVYNRNELILAIDTAKDHDKKILVEESIDGKELECAVMGNDKPIASGIGEIVPSNEFYNYNAKYKDNLSELHIPARIPSDLSEKIREIAIKAYKIMGCEGMSRVDFLVRKSDSKIFLNELNTIPGFTPISMFPKLMCDNGLEFSELINMLLNYASDRTYNKDSLT